jgi:hypothetical protein
MLSTASTLLIALSHTIDQDIVASLSTMPRSDSDSTLRRARFLLVVLAVVACILVEFLSWMGFRISDLVFAIYGSQLSLFPPVVYALFATRENLRLSATGALVAIALGFATGWATAFLGKIYASDNLVFLAPTVSLAVSGISLLCSIGATRLLRR